MGTENHSDSENEVSQESQASQTQTQGKRKTRVVSYNSPDRSLERYMYDEFKTKSIYAKDVPFEAIDITLYKPKAMLTAFMTSETRLPMWIKAIIIRYLDVLKEENESLTMNWEEYDNQQIEGKTDKITLTINKSHEKLFVISIFATTGRIQVQGSCYKDWANYEFPLLMKIVQLLNEHDDETIPHTFLHKLFEYRKESSELSESNHQLTDNDSEPVNNVSDCGDSPPSLNDNDDIYKQNPNSKNDNDDTSSSEEESDEESENDSRSNCQDSHLRHVIAKFESDFIESKLSFEKDITTIQQSLEDVSTLKDKIIRMENNLKAQLLTFDDKVFTQCQLQHKVFDDKCTDFTSQIKKLSNQLNQLTQKQSLMNEEIATLKNENRSLKQELFILKEITQKHENALDYNVSSATTSDQNESTVKHNQANPSTNKSNFTPETKTNAENKSRNPEAKPTNQYNVLPTQDPILILTDSNGKFIKPSLIHSEKKVIHHMTYTIQQIENKIQNEEFNEHNYSTILIHCGTNDLEKKNTEEVFSETTTILKLLKNNSPTTKIIYSSLLERHDAVNTKVNQLNSKMEQFCRNQAISFLTHHITHQQLFYDNKHLNRHGFKIFVKNLKSGIYGTIKQVNNNNRSSIKQAINHQNYPPHPQRSRSYGPYVAPQTQRTYANVAASSPRPVMQPPVNHFSGLPLHLKTLIQQLHSFTERL